MGGGTPTSLNLRDRRLVLGDDSPVELPRWVLKVVGGPLVVAMIGSGLMTYLDHERIAANEAAIRVLQVAAEARAVQEQRLEAVEKVIQMYEGPNGLRVQRAQEITELRTNSATLTKSVDRAIEKLDQLLLRGR